MKKYHRLASLAMLCFLLPLFSSVEGKVSSEKDSESISTVIDRIETYAHNPLGWPMLHYAIYQNRLEDAKIILQVYPEQALWYTPKMKLIYIHYGNDADGDDEELVGEDPGISAIELAVDHGDPELVSQLLTLGADVNEKREERVGALRNFWEPKGQPSVRENVKLVRGNIVTTKSLLYFAIQKQDLPMIELLMHHGANLNDTYTYFEERWAELGGDIHVVKNGYEVAADLNNDSVLSKLIYEVAVNSSMEGILNEESVSEQVKVVKTYVKNPLEWPALHYALHQNDLEAFQLFLELQMDPEYQGNAPQSLLEMSLEHSDPRFYESLVN